MNISYEELKNYEIVHIFEYYDGLPLIFISKSKSTSMSSFYYLNYYIEKVEKGSDKWFFSKLSSRERLDLLDKKISVLSLLSKLRETERLYHLIIKSNGDKCMTNYELVDDTNFDNASFPEEDFYIDFDYMNTVN